MAGKADFTEQEWEQLQRGALGAGMLVSISDPGFLETFKEAGAVGRHFAEAKKAGGTGLIGELAQSPPSGFGFGMRPQQLEEETLEALRGAAAALGAKAPDERPAYREFVLGVAESVANAADGVDPNETGAMDKIRSALGGG